MSYKADAEDSYDHLDFLLYEYTLNGSIRSVSKLGNKLSYCAPESKIGDSSWLNFGVNAYLREKCDLDTLKGSKLSFYEMYLVDHSTITKKLVPIPILNQKTGPDSPFRHRFFLYDFVSNFSKDQAESETFQYADRVRLDVFTRSRDNQHIYAPILTISYRETSQPKVEHLIFEVAYSSNGSKLITLQIVFLIISFVFTVAFVVLGLISRQRLLCHNRWTNRFIWQQMYAFSQLTLAVFYKCSFVSLLAFSGYVYVLFEHFPSVRLLLSSETSEKTYSPYATGNDVNRTFDISAHVVLGFVWLHLVVTLKKQSQLQVFFLDFEKTKAHGASLNAWRTILAAREWYSLTTVRKSSFFWTLITLIFLLDGMGCNFTVPIPGAQKHHTTLSEQNQLGKNGMLSFAAISFLWLGIWLGQRLWKFAIYERYFTEPRESAFIDLCTMAKISCFLLESNSCAYYLHCRSPYPYAEQSMEELVDQLESGQTGDLDRGLDRSLPGCQTFQVLTTRRWQRHLHGALQSASKRATQAKYRSEMQKPKWRAKDTNAICIFLKAFIENQDERFRWRLHRHHTAIGRLFGLLPNMSTVRHSYFVPGLLELSLNCS